MPTPKLHFSRAEFDQRIAKTRAAMQTRGLEQCQKRYRPGQKTLYRGQRP